MLVVLGDSLAARMDMELLINPSQIGIYGVLGDIVFIPIDYGVHAFERSAFFNGHLFHLFGVLNNDRPRPIYYDQIRLASLRGIRYSDSVLTNK